VSKVDDEGFKKPTGQFPDNELHGAFVATEDLGQNIVTFGLFVLEKGW
jgi:hypothetical protein